MKHFYSLVAVLVTLLCVNFPAGASARTDAAVATDDEIYGVFDEATSTLTLYYDDQLTARGGSDDWGFDYCDYVEKVVFHSSMKNARPTQTEHWFELFGKLTTIEHLDYLNTSQLTSIWAMFSGCKQLEQIDLSVLDLSKVTEVGYLFSECESLRKVNLGNLGNQDIDWAGGVFAGCKKLKEVDLSRWDMRNVAYTSEMFKDCESLTTIYCNANLTENAELGNSDDMFLHCYNLKGGMGTAYNNLHTDASYARPDGGASAPGYFTKTATGMEEVNASDPAGETLKQLRNGILYIRRGGNSYTLQGAETK